MAANSSKFRRLLEKHGPRDGWGVAVLFREVLPASLVSELMGIDQDGIVAIAPPKAERSASSACIFAATDNAIFMQGRLLPDADAFSMASSVELRVPWVDRAVLWAAQDLVASNEPQLGKMPIAAALDDSYLQRLVSRPKLGFQPSDEAVDDGSIGADPPSRERSWRAALVYYRPNSGPARRAGASPSARALVRNVDACCAKCLDGNQ